MGNPINGISEQYNSMKGAIKQAVEPLVAAAPKEDDDEAEGKDSGDNDFFSNLKAGVDFEDPPPKRIHVEGKIVANTDVPIAKPSHKKITTAVLIDDEVDPDFMSDDEDDEDVKEEDEEDHLVPIAKAQEK